MMAPLCRHKVTRFERLFCAVCINCMMARRDNRYADGPELRGLAFRDALPSGFPYPGRG